MNYKNHVGLTERLDLRITPELYTFLALKAEALYNEGLIPKASLSIAARHIIGEAKNNQDNK